MASTLADTTDNELGDETAKSFPPSHILQDGRFIFLPAPTDAERAKFLERSIARHNLLRSDLGTEKEEKEEAKEEGNKESTQPIVHPLAIASARLHANGISELSKAINLTGLVETGDYFGLTNIVDPSLEVPQKTPDSSQKESLVLINDQRLRAEYIGKRKRLQFEEASDVLHRHTRRVAAAVTAQSIIDQRLRALRPNWRLVAPEHGTRAQPHAVRPSELVAIDVDVYDQDRTGGQASSTMGRIARYVPRYATLELQNDYNVKDDLKDWKKRYGLTQEDGMEVEAEKKESSTVQKTRAEPFAVADPTLGKIDVDFDPDKVPMFTLQFDIRKPSTGFLQSACLSPLVAVEQGGNEETDENVICSLQHSLFCASLFESIRRELVPEDNGKTVGGLSKVHRTVWLSSEMDENFLPPPSLMAGGENNSGGARSLAVVHCHEGEIMVQLDCEYTLTVKLVEAERTAGDSMQVDDTVEHQKAESGSQSPEQLQALCRALLLHAQTVYHSHSMKTRAKSRQKETKQLPGLARTQQREKILPPRILENCVNLGTKTIFVQKIRRALKRVSTWLKSTMYSHEGLVVEWLPLSTFDLHSQFALCFLGASLDVSIERNEMTVTSIGDGSFRQVRFHLDTEFEMFLKMEIRRRIRSQDDQESGALTPTTENLGSSRGGQ
jgi:hypothetical protein